MKTTIGVMGSSIAEQSGLLVQGRLAELAVQMGRVIADRECVLVTGATSGLPHAVSVAAKAAGAMTIGISPAISEKEHRDRFNLPLDSLDVIVYTGFGLKGRNVVNVRSSDIVIIFGGSIGTLNELTIAIDEGKPIGVLQGTGGISDHVADVMRFCNRQGGISSIVFNENPEALVDDCLALLRNRNQS
jgi:uncharacterized protein (TIGR00725 family)